MPKDQQAAIDENGTITVRSSWAKGLQSSSGLTVGLFHEFLHSAGLKEPEVLKLVACCSVGFDPANISCSSLQSSSPLLKNALLADEKVKRVVEVLDKDGLGEKFQDELTSRLVSSDAKFTCLKESPPSTSCEDLVTQNAGAVEAEKARVCLLADYSKNEACKDSNISNELPNTPAIKTDKQAEKADPLQAEPITTSGSLQAKMTPVDITNKVAADQAVRDAIPAQKQALQVANNLLESAGAQVLPKAQAEEVVPKIMTTKTIPTAPAAPQSVARDAQTAPPQPPTRAASREAKAPAQQPTYVAGPAPAPPQAATEAAPRARDVVASAALRTRDAASSSAPAPSASAASQPSVNIVASGYKSDGTPILKNKETGAAVPTFAAFSGSPSASGSAALPYAAGSTETDTGRASGPRVLREGVGNGARSQGGGIVPQAGNGGGGSVGGLSRGPATAGAPTTRTAGNAKPRPVQAAVPPDLKSGAVLSAIQLKKIVRSAADVYMVLKNETFEKNLVRLSIQIVDGRDQYGELERPKTRWKLSTLIGDDE